MKRYLIVMLFITSVITSQVQAVRAESVVHSHFIEASGGISSLNGYFADIRYSTLIKPRFELGFSVSGYKGTVDKNLYNIPLSDITASFTLSHILLSAKRRTVALWGELSITGGYEMINNGSNTLSDGAILLSQSGFIYGIAPALRIDIPLSGALTLSCRFREKILPSSQAATFRSELSAGIKIKIF